MFMRYWSIYFGLALSASHIALAADAANGQFKFSACQGCHAIAGYTNAYPNYHVPRLAGQHSVYIETALRDYASGQRQHPTMQANAHTLSAEDMADIAAYLATQRQATTTQVARANPHMAPRLVRDNCANCHGMDGVQTTAPSFPKLAAQHEDYLYKALRDYQTGTRTNPIMRAQVAPLSDAELRELAQYFSKLAPGLATGQVK